VARVFFEPLPERERWLWSSCLLLGVLSGLPYLLCTYLPFTDLPMHQLSFATWVAPERFAPFYERRSYWLPYWAPFFAARPFVGLIGVEAAGRVPVFLYVAALPLTTALLSRAAGRSGYWGLLLAAFALEFNLAWGFVAYCLAGLLLQIVLACALYVEQARRPLFILGAEALAATALGFTHPQVAAAAVGGSVLLAAFGPRGVRGRRAGVVAASFAALVPSLVYFSDPANAAVFRLQGGMKFAHVGELLRRLPEFSIDVFDGPVEEALFACGALLLLLSWRAAPRVSFTGSRLPLLGVGFLLTYFVAPFDWNGQALAQRMPFLALLCLPGFAAPGRTPGLLVRAIIGIIAVVGVGNAMMLLRQFDRETAAELDPLTALAPPGAKTAYLAYDASWAGIHSLPHLHTGAYVTLRQGGVYAFHFNLLNTRYRDKVPFDQTLIGRELVLSRRYSSKREIVTLSPAQLSFWDTVLVRFPRDDEPFMPVRGFSAETSDFRYGHRFGLLRMRSAAAAPRRMRGRSRGRYPEVCTLRCDPRARR
jgi:hypothetical protein